MKPSRVSTQSDLFSSERAPPAVTSLQRHRDDLINLLSSLLQEVVQDPLAQTMEEKDHDQDQC